MSTNQRTPPAAPVPYSPEPEPDNEPEETPNISGRCQSCQSHVSESYVRVFGIDGRIYACLECSTRRDIKAGAGADPDYHRNAPPLSQARKQRGDTPRAEWEGRHATSPEGNR